MLYHRKHSKPQMLRLLQMCKDKTRRQSRRAQLAPLGARVLRHQPVAPPHQVLRGARSPPRHERRRADPHHPGPLSCRLLRLQDAERRRRRRPSHVPDRDRQRQRCRARRLPHRVPARTTRTSPTDPSTTCPGSIATGLEQRDSAAGARDPAAVEPGPPAAQPVGHPLRPGTHQGRTDPPTATARPDGPSRLERASTRPSSRGPGTSKPMGRRPR